MEVFRINSHPRSSESAVAASLCRRTPKASPPIHHQNKVLESPSAVARSENGRRWIITAWEQCQRVWANAPVPCLHSDPQFSDCPPAETKRLNGWLWFYQGEDIQVELRRLQQRMTSP